MTDGLMMFPWGTFTEEQVWQFTNFIEGPSTLSSLSISFSLFWFHR